MWSTKSISVLDAIASEILDEQGWPRKTPLPRDQVRQWIASNDLEVLGAARHLLERKEGFARVHPPLTPQEKRLFLTRYFERALAREQEMMSEDDSQWIDSGFDLNHGVVYWVANFLRDEQTPEAQRAIVLVWVRKLVLHAPFGSSLTTAVLDHLVWNRATKRYFKSWHTDAELAFLFER